MKTSLFKQVSAWLPLAMSAAALALLLGHVAIHGLVEEADEGTPAHIFQLLIVGQAPLIIYFGLRWLPKAPGAAATVLALQLGAACTAVGAVVWMEALAGAR